MIVSRYARKDPSFAQLLEYIQVDKGRMKADDYFTILHNTKGLSSDKILNSFKDNYKHLAKRKNGVVIDHEVMTFSPDDKGSLTLDMLEDLARKYIEIRGDKALCYAKPHVENDNMHVHFMFSHNEYKSKKTIRLSNKRFKEVRLDIEKYQKEKYPELEHSFVYLNKGKEAYKQQEREQNARDEKAYKTKKRNPQKLLKKDKARLALKNACNKATSMQSLESLLQAQNSALYIRGGKIGGIKYEGTKYRLTTLGFDKSIILDLQQRAKEQPKEIEKKENENILKKYSRYGRGGKSKDKGRGFER